MEGNEYELLIQSITDYAIFMIDTAGNITTWNAGAERVKGYTEDEIVGKNFRVLFLPEDQESRQPEQEMKEALETGKAEIEWWRVRKNGERFWAQIVLTPIYDEADKHVGFAKVTKDRTEWKRSDELNRFFLSRLTDYAIIVMDKKARIRTWSKGAENFHGYTEREAIGKHFSLFFSEEEKRKGEPERELAIAVNEGKYEGEAWRIKKDGAYFWSSFLMMPLDYNDGFILIARDRTRKKELEQASRADSVLKASNKELERFAYIVNHNLKEPVRKIAVFSGLLTPEDERQKRHLEKILNSCVRMQRLIDDILSYSLVARTQDFEKCSLTELLRSTINTLKNPITEKNATVTYGDLPEAVVIPAQIQQLFQHLLSNSLKYSRDNEPPVIKITHKIARKNDIDPGIREDLRPAPRYLCIRIKDNGLGFDQEYAEEIFGLFKRLHGKESFDGTGLGLSICKKVIENHGGTIRATSEEGKGSTFSTIIPF